jgi:transcriptional regulator with XRE-family HTH domain
MPSSDTQVQIGQRLRSARLQRGLSQGTVARRAGIAPSYLSRVETDSVQPTFRTVLRIHHALRADVAEILGQEQDEREGACPVSASGHCMLDLVRSEADASRGLGDEYYTPREIRLLRRVAAWMKAVKPDRLRAMEVLFEDLRRVAAEPPPVTRKRRRKTSRRAATR